MQTEVDSANECLFIDKNKKNDYDLKTRAIEEGVVEEQSR